MTKVEFAKHVKTMRKKIRLSQKELARLLNCGTPSLCNYEQGRGFPRDLDQFLEKLDLVVTDVSRHGKPDKKERRKYGEQITMGEDLDWQWYLEDILEAEEMYVRGIPLEMIASNFGRPNLETSIMLAIRSEEGHIEQRESGVFGRLDHGTSLHGS